MATESDIIFSRMTPQEQAEAWRIFTDLSSGKITPAQAATAQAANEKRVRGELAAPAAAAPVVATTPAVTAPVTTPAAPAPVTTPAAPAPGFSNPNIPIVTPTPSNVAPPPQPEATPMTPTPTGPAIGTPGRTTPVTPAPPAQPTQTEAQMAAAELRRQNQESARTVINELLANYGLTSLTDFVWNEITTGDITNPDILVQQIRKRPEYAARFPGMSRRTQAGFNAISEQEYIGLERAYRQTLRAAGIPADFYDSQDDFATLIGGDVSVAELSTRINDGYQAVAQASPQVVNEMRRLYGVDDGTLAAYFLDPTKATPMLLRQAQAAQIGAQAQEQAQMELSAQQAEQLAVAGVSPEQARQGFQAIAQAGELFVPLPGTTEQAITAEEQMAGVFGTQAAAQQRIRRRQRERQAAFEGGGRFAGQGATVTGLQ